MPTYSYRCTECDNAFDIVQAFTDDTLAACPVCGGKLRKVFSPVGVSFSGSGFYRNDSRAPTPSSPASASSSDSSSSSDSGSSAPTKTETKKESKPVKAAPVSTAPSSGSSSSSSS